MRGAFASRRSLLAGAARLTAVGPMLGAWAREASAAGSFSLSPPYTANWRIHKTFAGARISQITGGVGIVTPHASAQADLGQVALWSIGTIRGDFDLGFTYKVTFRAAVAGGSFGTFYFDTRGEGGARYVQAVPNWAAATPGDALYADHARGLRFSFATSNPGAPDVHQRLRLRCFQFTPVLSQVGAESPQVFPFTTGTAYSVRVRRQRRTLSVSVTPAGGGAAQSFSWTDPRISRWGEGHIGFRWRAQDCEVTNFG